MVIVVLSTAGWTAPEIAGLLHYDPKTVRAWIARHHNEGLTGLPDRPRSGRSRKASRPLGQRIHTLLTPKAWTTTRIWRALGRPATSLSTMRHRIREQARGAPPDRQKHPHHDQICADIRDRIAALPEGSVVLAEDETHIDLLARVRSCWMPVGLRHRIVTPGTNIRRTVHGAVNLLTGTVHHHVSVKNAETTTREHLRRDHHRSGPPSPCVLPAPHRRPEPDHRSTLDLTMATRGIREGLLARGFSVSSPAHRTGRHRSRRSGHRGRDATSCRSRRPARPAPGRRRTAAAAPCCAR
jgi:hypothetical protein